MVQAAAPILLQRMRGLDLGISPDAPCVLAVNIEQASAIEGAVLNGQIERVGGRSDQDVTVTYTWSSVGGAADLTAPLVTVLTIPANVMVIAIPMQSVARAGSQGDREARVTLSAPINCTLSETNSFAVVTLQDAVASPAVIGAFVVGVATISEADTAFAQIRRVSGDPSATVLVDWTWTSSGGNGDFAAGAVLSGTATISSSVASVDVSVATAVQSGLQGNRAINLTLSNIRNGQISTSNPIAVFTLKDYVPSPVTVGIYPKASSVVDDGTTPVTMQFKRLGGVGACSAVYTFTSALNPFDFDAGAVLTGTCSLAAGVNTVDVAVAIRDRSAADQGDRDIKCTLSTPVGCTITDAVATTVLTDKKTADPGLPKLQNITDTVAGRANWHMVGLDKTAKPGCKAYYPTGRTGFDQARNAIDLAPGDVIVLADGTYSGTKITFTKNGTKTADGSKHLMVRALNHRKAIIDLQLDVNGEYWWFTGLQLPWDKGYGAGDDYNSDGNSILCRKRGLWVTNCACTSATFMSIINPSTLAAVQDNLRICYNDLLCSVPLAVGSIGVIVYHDWNGNWPAPHDTDIAYNKMTYGPFSSNNPRNFVNLQNSKAGTLAAAVSKDHRWHHNHMVGHVATAAYFKRNVYFGYNYVKWLVNGYEHDITFRHGIQPDAFTFTPGYGIGGIMEGNLFDGDGPVKMELNGHGMVCNGNKFIGANGGAIHVCAGEEPPNPGGGLHDAADYAVVVDNVGFGEIEMGTVNTNHDMLNTRGGWVDHVRVYDGDRGWTYTITRGQEVYKDNSGNIIRLGEKQPLQIGGVNCWDVFSGYPTSLGINKVTTITEAELLAVVGCDAP